MWEREKTLGQIICAALQLENVWAPHRVGGVSRPARPRSALTAQRRSIGADLLRYFARHYVCKQTCCNAANTLWMYRRSVFAMFKMRSFIKAPFFQEARHSKQDENTSITQNQRRLVCAVHFSLCRSASVVSEESIIFNRIDLIILVAGTIWYSSCGKKTKPIQCRAWW